MFENLFVLKTRLQMTRPWKPSFLCSNKPFI